MSTTHALDEIMAGTWDSAGYLPPSSWRFLCGCGTREAGFAERDQAFTAWQFHVRAATHREGSPSAGPPGGQ